uniref:Uncharacterized protein n=1 Tax=Corethron hystrix TaxID=216773 RepID=A0A6U5HQF7_9STRA|mmetsp:Transcript_31147/g.71215  ORF Transcript_31147/g.71215 Transcript_31147/m.71215 type:complete len:1026 (+) Transcript_31147:732-3809(+)
MVECSRKRIMSKDATFASVESENEGTKRLKSANGEKNSNVSSVPSQNNGETSFQRCCNTLLADKVLSLNRNIGQKAAKNDANGIETIEEPQVVPSNFTPALDFVNAKKTIPRCYPKSTDQILTLARQQLILNIIKRDIKHSMIEYVCIDIQQSSSNSYTDEVTLTAPRKVMNDVICKVDKILSDSIALYNIKNMNCIELILQLETSGSIGGKVYDICPEMENQVGLLVVGANEGSELHKVVGPAVKTGLCISQIEEIKVVSSIQVKNAWHVVRKRGSRFANVTCSFPKSSDLSSILAERIIKKHIINARILEDTIIASNDTTTDDGSMSSEISVILPPVDKILVKPEGKTKVASFESDQIEQDTNKHMEKLVTLSQKRKHTEKDMLSENKHLETSEKMEDSSWNKIFRKKFNPVCDIEYQKMVKKNTALGSMWRKHKLLYGDVCNEDCMCVSDLKTLCENVIQDSKKSTKFNIDSYNEVGFVSHFHPRFYKKVKEGYPSLNGAIILEKLVKMWKKHTRTMRYGMKCNKNCECEDGWENIFVPTFLGPMETIAKSVNTSKCVPKKSLPEGKTSHSTSTQKLKKKTILLKGDKSGALIQPSQKVSLLANIQTPSAQNFSYTFDTDKPMGICFFTINSVCTVLSVDRNNQVISNTGIKAGFIVKTVLVKDSITHSKTVDILSHDMVKVLYKNAAKGKKKLRLSFTQGSVESFEKEIRTDFWTDNGEWKGFHLHHWAGGSPCVYSPLPCSSSSKERNNSSAESMIECTQNLRKLRDTNLTAESILRITKYTENGNNFGLRSAHTVSSIPTLKKVRFCDGDALSSVVSYVTFIQCEEKHKDDSVVKKALSMDFKEFLNFLLSGADFSQEDMWEKSPTIHINQKICDIRDTIEHGNCNSFSKKSKTAELKDLELKSTLLQIYSDGEVLLENAEKMWKWATIEYKLFGLDQLVLKERGRSDAHVENLIFCVAKVNHEKLISSELSHEKEYHDSVCWNDNESSFKFHYNLESDRSHDLCFEIRQVSKLNIFLI